MNSFYIYSFQYKKKEERSFKEVSATVIFCSCNDIEEKDLQSEIKKFYEQHYQTDEIFVLGSNHDVPRLTEVFIANQDQTFKGVPKRQETFLKDNLFLLSFNKDGALKSENAKKIPKEFEETFKNEGLQQIFICRGGLIVSEASHHYVFPSGKHCDRFLRTGNILLYSPEIFFIAFTLLKHFNEEEYSRIYCDTSSIISIAFALFDLKNSFLEKKHKVSIESFSSYDGLYKNPETYTKDSFLLVSASTSANIIKYIIDRHKIIDRDNIIILFFLANDTDYSNVKDQVLCNLTKNTTNPNGIDFYPTYTDRDCEFCKKGSYAVPVAGDVFLLEKPKVNKILLGTGDREKGLSKFVHQFMSENKKDSVFKVHYKERSDYKYEVYIDYTQILKGMDTNPRYDYHKNKLNDYIQQYIPTNTRYILFLNDEGSQALAKHVFEKIAPLYIESSLPILLSQEKLQDIKGEVSGAIVVIGSCISNGKNLLYISRALRKFDQLRILYFIGIARTTNAENLKTLKSNLQRGRYGSETNGFIAVETMYCSNSSKSSPWMVETEFLKEMIQYILDFHPEYKDSLDYFRARRKNLADYSGESKRGTSQELFYPRITTEPIDELELRKNFAFFDFENYYEHVSQSDTFFTISNIINSLRNSTKIDRQLKQTVYVRTLLAPDNFNRFNDGIIQAAILRTANPDELAYAIDENTSLEMYNTLDTIIGYYKQEQGEGLLEFLYAIAIKKLSLTLHHLTEILKKIKSNCKEEMFQCFADYIEEKLINEPARLKSTPLPPSTKAMGAPEEAPVQAEK